MYCTITDIKKAISEEALIQITDDENMGLVDEAVVAQAIAKADSEIDAYVGKVKPLPLNPVPAILKRLSIDMAAYHLYSRRNVDEVRLKEYEHCIRILRDISEGKISIGIGQAHVRLYEV